jgi:hypothetical protein
MDLDPVIMSAPGPRHRAAARRAMQNTPAAGIPLAGALGVRIAAVQPPAQVSSDVMTVGTMMGTHLDRLLSRRTFSQDALRFTGRPVTKVT